jgi:2-iminobutanoate/2-iminopropanoate deaminase
MRTDSAKGLSIPTPSIGDEVTMSFTHHNPDDVPPPLGGYSQALELPPGARLLIISGQIPERPGQEMAIDFRGQCEAVWDNIEANLAAAGMEIGDLVKVTTYLTSREQVVENREVRQRRLGNASPALTVVIAQTLDPRWLLEIEAIAARVVD